MARRPVISASSGTRPAAVRGQRGPLFDLSAYSMERHGSVGPGHEQKPRSGAVINLKDISLKNLYIELTHINAKDSSKVTS
jgi:hypothetical protein